MEGNKLIAEFMELETETFNSHPFTKVKSTGILNYYYHGTLDRIIDQGWFEAHELSYNVSWDWLMPVVDKIESFTDDNKCCKYNVNIEQCWVEIIDNQTSDEIVSVDGDDKLLATHKAVVEFIKIKKDNINNN